MQFIAPLVQTILWVSLVAGIVIRFHRPIHGILNALRRRIEAGSAIEAGPIKLGAEVKPANLAQQRERSDAEINQIIRDQLGRSTSDEILDPEVRIEQRNLRSQLFQAEELALRAIQAEYNSPINRQVTIGPNIKADGAFIYLDELHLVEVKLIINPENATNTVARTLENYNRSFGPTRKKSVVIVLVLVYESRENIKQFNAKFLELAGKSDLRVKIFGYSLSELQAIYGFMEGD